MKQNSENIDLRKNKKGLPEQTVMRNDRTRPVIKIGKKNGGSLGIRTLDPLIKSQLLCQLS